MKSIVVFTLTLLSFTLKAQNSDLIIKAPDTLDFTLFIEGKEYKTDDAPIIKITQIPEDALLNINVMTKTAQPMACFQRIEFNGSNELVYEIKVAEKGKKLELELLLKTKKTDKYKSFDMNDNFIVYKYNKYVNPLERVKGTMKGASSLTMKREREKTDTTKMEDGKKVEEKSERKRTVKNSGSSTIVHHERKTTGEGDARESNILKPRKGECNGEWKAYSKKDAMKNLSVESRESGKIYISKKIAVENCFKASDAGFLLESFDNESSRIEIAKFLYPSLTDPENFDVLEEYFDSPSSWEAIKLYIEIKYE